MPSYTPNTKVLRRSMEDTVDAVIQNVLSEAMLQAVEEVTKAFPPVITGSTREPGEGTGVVMNVDMSQYSEALEMLMERLGHAFGS